MSINLSLETWLDRHGDYHGYDCADEFEDLDPVMLADEGHDDDWLPEFPELEDFDFECMPAIDRGAVPGLD